MVWFKQKKIIFRVLAWLVIIQFIGSHAVWAQEGGKIAAPVVPTAMAGPTPDEIISLYVPEAYGDVKKATLGTEDKVIIHIQDSHVNYEAQTNIIKILNHLVGELSQKNNGNGPGCLIAVEGAAGPSDPGWFRLFPNKEVKKSVLDYFLRRGFISGPQYFQVFADHVVPVVGVEEAELYRENLAAFRETYAHSEEVVGAIAELERGLNLIRDKLYNDDLRQFSEKSAAFHSNKLVLTDYVTYLRETANAKGVDLAAFAQITATLEAIAADKAIDYGEVNKERTKLVDKLQSRLTQEDVSELVSNSLYFRLGKMSSLQYYTFLEELARDNGIEIEEYPQMEKYLEALNLHSQIEPEFLFQEIGRAEKRIKESLFQTKEERECDRQLRNLYLLRNLCKLEMSREELQEYRDNRDQFLIEEFLFFIEDESTRLNLDLRIDPKVDRVNGYFQAMEKFYQAALARDEALAQRTLEAMDQQKVKTAIVVSGGFHTEGLVRKFEGENLSTMVVSPRITLDVGNAAYLDAMLNELMPLERVLRQKGNRLSQPLRMFVRVPLVGTAADTQELHAQLLMLFSAVMTLRDPEAKDPKVFQERLKNEVEKGLSPEAREKASKLFDSVKPYEVMADKRNDGIYIHVNYTGRELVVAVANRESAENLVSSMRRFYETSEEKGTVGAAVFAVHIEEVAKGIIGEAIPVAVEAPALRRAEEVKKAPEPEIAAAAEKLRSIWADKKEREARAAAARIAEAVEVVPPAAPPAVVPAEVPAPVAPPAMPRKFIEQSIEEQVDTFSRELASIDRKLSEYLEISTVYLVFQKARKILQGNDEEKIQQFLKSDDFKSLESFLLRCQGQSVIAFHDSLVDLGSHYYLLPETKIRSLDKALANIRDSLSGPQEGEEIYSLTEVLAKITNLKELNARGAEVVANRAIQAGFGALSEGDYFKDEDVELGVLQKFALGVKKPARVEAVPLEAKVSLLMANDDVEIYQGDVSEETRSQVKQALLEAEKTDKEKLGQNAAQLDAIALQLYIRIKRPLSEGALDQFLNEFFNNRFRDLLVTSHYTETPESRIIPRHRRQEPEVHTQVRQSEVRNYIFKKLDEIRKIPGEAERREAYESLADIVSSFRITETGELVSAQQSKDRLKAALRLAEVSSGREKIEAILKLEEILRENRRDTTGLSHPKFRSAPGMALYVNEIKSPLNTTEGAMRRDLNGQYYGFGDAHKIGYYNVAQTIQEIEAFAAQMGQSDEVRNDQLTQLLHQTGNVRDRQLGTYLLIMAHPETAAQIVLQKDEAGNFTVGDGQIELLIQLLQAAYRAGHIDLPPPTNRASLAETLGKFAEQLKKDGYKAYALGGDEMSAVIRNPTYAAILGGVVDVLTSGQAGEGVALAAGFGFASIQRDKLYPQLAHEAAQAIEVTKALKDIPAVDKDGNLAPKEKYAYQYGTALDEKVAHQALDGLWSQILAAKTATDFNKLRQQKSKPRQEMWKEALANMDSEHLEAFRVAATLKSISGRALSLLDKEYPKDVAKAQRVQDRLKKLSALLSETSFLSDKLKVYRSQFPEMASQVDKLLESSQALSQKLKLEDADLGRIEERIKEGHLLYLSYYARNLDNPALKLTDKTKQQVRQWIIEKTKDAKDPDRQAIYNELTQLPEEEAPITPPAPAAEREAAAGKGVLVPVYGFASGIVAPAVNFVSAFFGAKPLTKNQIEDFIVPVLEEGAMFGLGLLLGGLPAYVGVRALFVLLHAIQDRAPPIAEEKPLGDKIRNLLRSVTLPAVISAAAVLPLVAGFGFLAVLVVGTLVHAAANYSVSAGLPLAKGVMKPLPSPEKLNKMLTDLQNNVREGKITHINAMESLDGHFRFIIRSLKELPPAEIEQYNPILERIGGLKNLSVQMELSKAGSDFKNAAAAELKNFLSKVLSIVEDKTPTKTQVEGFSLIYSLTDPTQFYFSTEREPRLRGDEINQPLPLQIEINPQTREFRILDAGIFSAFLPQSGVIPEIKKAPVPAPAGEEGKLEVSAQRIPIREITFSTEVGYPDGRVVIQEEPLYKYFDSIQRKMKRDETKNAQRQLESLLDRIGEKILSEAMDKETAALLVLEIMKKVPETVRSPYQTRMDKILNAVMFSEEEIKQRQAGYSPEIDFSGLNLKSNAYLWFQRFGDDFRQMLAAREKKPLDSITQEDILRSLMELEWHFRRSCVVTQLESGQYGKVSREKSYGETIFGWPGSKVEYEIYQDWLQTEGFFAEPVLQKEELKSWIENFLKSKNIQFSDGGASQEQLSYVKMLYEKYLDPIISRPELARHLKSVHLGSTPRGVGMAKAGLSMYDAEKKAVRIYDFLPDIGRRGFGIIFIHEHGHAIEHALSDGVFTSRDPRFTKDKLENIHRFLHSKDALFGMDYFLGAEQRKFYQELSFGEFIAETFAAFMVQGQELRRHIESFPEESDLRKGWEVVWAFFSSLIPPTPAPAPVPPAMSAAPVEDLESNPQIASTHAAEKHPDRNEDAIFVKRLGEVVVAGVFDGMGGYAAGEVASLKAKNAVQSVMIKVAANASEDKVRSELKSAFRQGREAIQARVAQDKALSGMGTTGVVARVFRDVDGKLKAVIANAGDSRAVILTAQGKIRPVTEDDSQIKMWADYWLKKDYLSSNLKTAKAQRDRLVFMENADEAGAVFEEIKAENADKIKTIVEFMSKNYHPEMRNVFNPNNPAMSFFNIRNVIVKSLGSEEKPSLYTVELQPGERLILTSDGVHDNLTNKEIEEAVRQAQKQGQDIAAAVVAAARFVAADDFNPRQKDDDITAVVVDYDAVVKTPAAALMAIDAKPQTEITQNNVDLIRQQIVTYPTAAKYYLGILEKTKKPPNELQRQVLNQIIAEAEKKNDQESLARAQKLEKAPAAVLPYNKAAMDAKMMKGIAFTEKLPPNYQIALGLLDSFQVGRFIFSIAAWDKEGLHLYSFDPKTEKSENKYYSWNKASQGITIGRGEENDIWVEDLEASRQHATLLLKDRQLFLIDNNSTNGTPYYLAVSAPARAMKQIGPLDNEDEIRKISEAEKAAFFKLAEGKPAETVSIRQDNQFKAIVVRGVTTKMMQGLKAINFEDKDGNVYIFVSGGVKSKFVQEEGIYHEAAEAYWLKQIRDKKVDFSGIKIKGIPVTAERAAHILASAEQILRFAEKGKLTHYHQQQVALLSIANLRKIIREDRTEHQEVLKVANQMLKANIDLDQILNYEKLLRTEARSRKNAKLAHRRKAAEVAAEAPRVVAEAPEAVRSPVPAAGPEVTPVATPAPAPVAALEKAPPTALEQALESLRRSDMAAVNFYNSLSTFLDEWNKMKASEQKEFMDRKRGLMASTRWSVEEFWKENKFTIIEAAKDVEANKTGKTVDENTAVNKIVTKMAHLAILNFIYALGEGPRVGKGEVALVDNEGQPFNWGTAWADFVWKVKNKPFEVGDSHPLTLFERALLFALGISVPMEVTGQESLMWAKQKNQDSSYTNLWNTFYQRAQDEYKESEGELEQLRIKLFNEIQANQVDPKIKDKLKDELASLLNQRKLLYPYFQRNISRLLDLDPNKDPMLYRLFISPEHRDLLRSQDLRSQVQRVADATVDLKQVGMDKKLTLDQIREMIQAAKNKYQEAEEMIVDARLEREPDWTQAKILYDAYISAAEEELRQRESKLDAAKTLRALLFSQAQRAVEKELSLERRPFAQERGPSAYDQLNEVRRLLVRNWNELLLLDLRLLGEPPEEVKSVRDQIEKDFAWLDPRIQFMEATAKNLDEILAQGKEDLRAFSQEAQNVESLQKDLAKKSWQERLNPKTRQGIQGVLDKFNAAKSLLDKFYADHGLPQEMNQTRLELLHRSRDAWAQIRELMEQARNERKVAPAAPEKEEPVVIVSDEEFRLIQEEVAAGRPTLFERARAMAEAAAGGVYDAAYAWLAGIAASAAAAVGYIRRAFPPLYSGALRVISGLAVAARNIQKAFRFEERRAARRRAIAEAFRARQAEMAAQVRADREKVTERVEELWRVILSGKPMLVDDVNELRGLLNSLSETGDLEMLRLSLMSEAHDRARTLAGEASTPDLISAALKEKRENLQQIRSALKKLLNAKDKDVALETDFLRDVDVLLAATMQKEAEAEAKRQAELARQTEPLRKELETLKTEVEKIFGKDRWELKPEHQGPAMDLLIRYMEKKNSLAIALEGKAKHADEVLLRMLQRRQEAFQTAANEGLIPIIVGDILNVGGNQFMVSAIEFDEMAGARFANKIKIIRIDNTGGEIGNPIEISPPPITPTPGEFYPPADEMGLTAGESQSFRFILESIHTRQLVNPVIGLTRGRAITVSRTPAERKLAPEPIVVAKPAEAKPAEEELRDARIWVDQLKMKDLSDSEVWQAARERFIDVARRHPELTRDLEQRMRRLEQELKRVELFQPSLKQLPNYKNNRTILAQIQGVVNEIRGKPAVAVAKAPAPAPVAVAERPAVVPAPAPLTPVAPAPVKVAEAPAVVPASVAERARRAERLQELQNLLQRIFAEGKSDPTSFPVFDVPGFAFDGDPMNEGDRMNFYRGMINVGNYKALLKLLEALNPNAVSPELRPRILTLREKLKNEAAPMAQAPDEGAIALPEFPTPAPAAAILGDLRGKGSIIQDRSSKGEMALVLDSDQLPLGPDGNLDIQKIHPDLMKLIDNFGSKLNIVLFAASPTKDLSAVADALVKAGVARSKVKLEQPTADLTAASTDAEVHAFVDQLEVRAHSEFKVFPSDLVFVTTEEHHKNVFSRALQQFLLYLVINKEEGTYYVDADLEKDYRELTKGVLPAKLKFVPNMRYDSDAIDEMKRREAAEKAA